MKALLVWNPAVVGEANTARAVIETISKLDNISLLTTDIEVGLADGAIEVDGVIDQLWCDTVVIQTVEAISRVRPALAIVFTTNYSRG